MIHTFVNATMVLHWPMIKEHALLPPRMRQRQLQRLLQIQVTSKFKRNSFLFTTETQFAKHDFYYSSFCRDCSAGYVKNEQSGQCDDIDECEGSDVKCNMETQVCYNLPGSYQCLDILPAPTARVCPHGFKFDEKIKQCTGQFKIFRFFTIFSTEN